MVTMKTDSDFQHNSQDFVDLSISHPRQNFPVFQFSGEATKTGSLIENKRKRLKNSNFPTCCPHFAHTWHKLKILMFPENPRKSAQPAMSRVNTDIMGNMIV